MAISIAWGTKIISVPKSYLTLVSGSVYELDMNQFRLDLKDLEDSEEGMAFPDTHRHNTEVTLAGVTYSRFVEIINGYTVTFEDGAYAVNVVGANTNIADVMNVNQVSLRTSNTAGLITVNIAGVDAPTAPENAAAVWNALLTSFNNAGTFGNLVIKIEKKTDDTQALIFAAK